MKVFAGLFLIAGVAVMIRDNNVHFIWKGFLAGWPILMLLAVAGFFIWQGLPAKAHKHFQAGHHKGTNSPIGDPLESARDSAEKAGVEIHIPNVEDMYRQKPRKK